MAHLQRIIHKSLKPARFCDFFKIARILAVSKLLTRTQISNQSLFWSKLVQLQDIISKSLKLPQIYNFSNIARILAVSKFLTRTEISNFTFEVLKSHTDLITPNWSTAKWFSINAQHWLFKFGIYSKLHEFVTFWNFFVETPQSWHCF